MDPKQVKAKTQIKKHTLYQNMNHHTRKDQQKKAGPRKS